MPDDKIERLLKKPVSVHCVFLSAYETKSINRRRIQKLLPDSSAKLMKTLAYVIIKNGALGHFFENK